MQEGLGSNMPILIGSAMILRVIVIGGPLCLYPLPVHASPARRHRTGISLGLMGLASFPIIQNFGITSLIVVGFSQMGAIFIMPAVLSLMGNLTERLEEKKKHSE